MAVLLFIGVLLQSFLATAQSNVSPTNAPWLITGSSAYNAATDTTVFSYKVNSYLNGFVSYLHVGFPSCPEIECTGNLRLTLDSESGIRGYKLNQDVRPGRTWTYTISVLGMVGTGQIPYSIGGVRVSSGIQNYHQYSEATIVGPKCSVTPKISCSISQERFTGECIGDTVRIPLSTTTQHYTSLKWSTDYAGCSFTQSDTANPVITFHGPICDTEFTVTLEVWGENGQYEMCTTFVSATDITPPTFGGVYGSPDITVQCDDIPAPLHIIAKDTCDNDVQVTFSEVEEDVDYGEYSIYRTWTAVDNCDNIKTYNQVVVVADREPPTLVGVPDNNVIDCRLDVKPCVVVAHDNCDEVTVEREDQVLEGTCVDSWLVIRTWIAEDSSHNAVTARQTVTVQDTERPQLLGVPADTQVECDQVPANVVPSAVDNCQEDLDISISERIIPGSCSDEYTIYRSFGVGDECGNHLNQDWIITVVDNSPPVISEVVEDHGERSCDEIPVPCVVDATDNCAVYAQSIEPSVEKVSVVCINTYTLQYIWTVTDNCGNTNRKVSQIQVTDSTPPKFSVTVPYQLRASCNHAPEVNVHATDNCGQATVVFDESKTDSADYGRPCAHNYVLYREWHATDDCGNEAFMFQTVNVIDDIPPVMLSIPPDMTLPCDQPLDVSELAVTGSDNCGCVEPVIFAERGSLAGNCPQNKRKLYYWSVQDCCGHMVEAYATITYYDDTPPRLYGIPGSVFSQVEDINSIPYPVVTAQDNCVNTIIVEADSNRVLGSCLHNYKIIHTWSASDDCGNTVSMSQTVYCDDSSPPTFDEPNYDSAVECPLTGYTIISATDNSPIYEVGLKETRETVPGRCEDEYSVLRHFVATDPCGNTAMKTYTVHVYDTQPPSWATLPHQEELYIVIDTLEAYNANYVDDVTAWDLCAHSVDVEFDETTSPMSCENEYVIRRKWTASDNCGNSVTISRTIDVQDQTPPSLINVPVDASVDCTDDYANMYTSPTAEDYGYTGELEISVSLNVISGTCRHNFVAVKCWTVHDCVGQHDVECQTITVTDTNAPSFVYVPPHTTVPCYDVPEPVDLGTAGIDDCGSALVTRTEVRESGSCDNNYLIIHTYTVEDECDLSSTYAQTVTVVDEDAPYFDYVPSYQALECGSFSRYIAATCLDTCDYTLDITNTRKDIAGTCDDETINVRAWRCVDDCGNEATAEQSITFSDVVPPRFSFTPRDLSLPCKADSSAMPSPPPIRAYDNCDSNVDVTLSDYVKPGAYGLQSSTNIRVWIATDNCGNTAELQQTVIIFDNIPPVVYIPQSVVLDCRAPYVVPTYESVTDNCDPNPEVDVSVLDPYNLCANNYVKEYEWCPRDKSGNLGECRKMRITVTDTAPPNWTSDLPALYKEVSYTASWGPDLDITASDNCDLDVSVTWDTDGSVKFPCPLEERVVYNYHASDICGNTATYSHTIIVVDDVPPPLSPNPPHTTIECPAELPVPAVLSSDDPYSYEPFPVAYSQQVLPNSCEQELIVERRWVARDCAFNFNTWVQTITIQDTTPPSLPELNDLSLTCNENDDYTALEAYDACDQYVDVEFITETIGDACASKVYRQWIASDDCGNQDVLYQTLTITDTEAPQLYGTPADVTVDNHNVPGFYELQCSDNCETDFFTAAFQETTLPGSCEDEWSINRKWTCTDACGLTFQYAQEIEVVDDEIPEISYCPSDITVQLGLVPPPPVLTAVDGQVYDTVDVIYNQENETAYRQEIMYIYTRTWTAEDNCANIASCQQIVTVIDTVPPIIPDVPRDTYIDCDDDIINNWDAEYAKITEQLQASIASVEQVDITPNTVPYPKVQVRGTCKGEYTLQRTWTATDHAGNSLSDTQILSVVDDRPPVFSWEDCGGLQLSIHEECSHSDVCNPTVTDNCDPYTVANLHEKRIKGTCANEYIIVRLWDAQDNCGNIVAAKQTVYVGDSNPPNLSPAPSDLELSCTSYNTLPEYAVLDCSDVCSGEIEPRFHSTKHVGSCTDSWVIIRSWSCSDVCGHEVHTAQTITTVDNTEPSFDEQFYGDIDIPCEQEPPVMAAKASDDCAELVQVHYEIIGYTVGYISDTFVQQWVAYDNCGNSAVKSRNVHVVDTVDPVIAPRPPSAVIPCDQYSAYEMPEPHCEDNCDRATISRQIETLSGTCESEYTLVVEWNCDDPHGNNVSHVMQISVVDNEAPIIDVKGLQIEAPCYDVPPAPSGTVSDNCDSVTIEFSEVSDYPEYILGSVADPIDFSENGDSPRWEYSQSGYFFPEYYAISPMVIQSLVAKGRGMRISLSHCETYCMFDDRCYGAQLWSNSGQAPFKCYLYSREAICEVQHEGYKIPETQSGITYRSNVGHWVIKRSGLCTVIPEEYHLCDRYELVRTWSADDLCGNHAEVVQSIRVWDDTPPIWDVVPNDATDDCTKVYESNDDLSASHGIRAPEATDDCTSELTVSETVDRDDGVCATNYVLTYVWVVEDTCGNAATASMKLTKVDDTPPTLGYVTPDEDVECVNPPVQPDDPTCEDDCNAFTVVSSSASHSGSCDYQLIYTWTCTDDCGNSASTQQRLNIADTTPPTLDTPPADTTLDCVELNDGYADPSLNCNDDCGGCSVAESVTKSVLDCASNQLWIYRYIATDNCGNRVESYRSVTYLDITPPTFENVPEDYEVPCQALYDDVPVSCHDDCGGCILKFSESTVDYDCLSTSKYHVVYRTWTGTDICGHVSIESQTVTVTDGSNPNIIKPDDRTIQCDDQHPSVTANANDDCGEVTLSDSSTTLQGTCEDEYKIVKTWVAIDRCGNQVQASHTLFVIDTEIPTINGIPNDVAVACDQIPDVPNVNINDHCSYPTPHFEEISNRDQYSCNAYDLVRSWWAADDCGNVVNGSYTVVISDNEDPVLTCNGADRCEDIQIECEIYPVLPIVVAHDNCYEHLEITYTASPELGTCEHDHKEYRTWTTDDGCGHTDSVSQTITYFDHTPPVLEGHVPDTTVECPNNVAVPLVTSNDNCDYALDVVYTDTQEPGLCKGVYVEYRLWTSADLCGNSDWIAQTVTVIDTTPPSLDVYATHEKVECDRLSDVWNGAVTASDDCDYNMAVKFTEEKFDGSCSDSYTLVRRWSTVDCSGNTAAHVQTIYVQDTLPPYFLGTVPQDVTVSQSDVYSSLVSIDRFDYEADDNCASPVVRFEEVEVPMDYDCDFLYYIIRTWSIVDDCGNSESMTQTIDMVETEAPTISQPLDEEVECDSVPPPCDVSIIGDSYQATLTFFETRVDGDCESEYDLIRTWVATDCAYNSASVTQTITVSDTQKPAFTRTLVDVTGECDCDDVFTVPVLDVVDNCGLGDEVVYYDSYEEPGTCEHDYYIYRSWEINDACGQKAEQNQVVHITDSTPPKFCDCPSNYFDFECDEVPTLDGPTVMDNCDDAPTLTPYDSGFILRDDHGCNDQGYIAYKWVTEDACGNYDECEATINVIDTKPPHVVNGDRFCYPLNGYGPTSNEWAVYRMDSVCSVVDSCEGATTKTFLNCTSEYGSDDDCFQFQQQHLNLYVKMVASHSAEKYTGRYYNVWFSVMDNCHNTIHVKRVIWVPSTPHSYEDAVNRGECPFGIGTDTFQSAPPSNVGGGVRIF